MELEYIVIRGNIETSSFSSGKSFELDNFTKFIVAVNQHIELGWVPLGGVALGENSEIFQAMTMEKK